MGPLLILCKIPGVDGAYLPFPKESTFPSLSLLHNIYFIYYFAVF